MLRWPVCLTRRIQESSLSRVGRVARPYFCMKRKGAAGGEANMSTAIRKTTGEQTPAGGERQPGLEHEMEPKPQVIRAGYKGADKLKGKVAVITGGDSGIGRSVAVHYAREGAAGVVIAYLDEHKDAEETKSLVEQEGARALTIAGDVGDYSHCRVLINQTMSEFGRIDVLVNNAGEQHIRNDISEIKPEQLHRTFRTNVFSQFYLSQAALEHMREGACIINTSSVTAYKGMAVLLDYSASKGAVVSFTRSLALHLAPRNIRVNAVAPGPIWTPLIPATFPEEKVKDFGEGAALKRSGQPAEVAPSYVFLASDDSTYFTGQVLHPNGGSIVNG